MGSVSRLADSNTQIPRTRTNTRDNEHLPVNEHASRDRYGWFGLPGSDRLRDRGAERIVFVDGLVLVVSRAR
ncbi:MAG: hypothetical protein RLZZ450_5982 [Pseudomonadota bacterium]|jgi:hypothetical protein